MKVFVLISSLILSMASSAALASGCGGNTTNCWDPCTSRYKPVAGDQCETKWDSSRGCYTAVGKCGGGGGTEPIENCRHDTETCWDSCTSSYVRFENANACTTAWNSGKGCYETIGYCRH